MEGPGETCKDLGLVEIESLDKCTASVDSFQAIYPAMQFKNEETDSAYPKGCYAYVDTHLKNFGIYFNAHVYGSGNKFSRALCRGVEGRKQECNELHIGTLNNLQFPSYFLSDFYIINILDCSEDEECTGLSDTCNSRICMCGVSPICSNQTSDACESGKCRCGSNLECKGTFCISGVCRQGTFFVTQLRV